MVNTFKSQNARSFIYKMLYIRYRYIADRAKYLRGAAKSVNGGWEPFN